jgi:hypothetical protein
VTSAELGSPLRRLLQETAAEHGLDLKDLTVLAPQNDPFRVDTPARHRDGAWLAATIRELGLTDRRIHLRGLHYAITMHPEPVFKPNGERYVNSHEDWLWLSGDAGKAASSLSALDCRVEVLELDSGILGRKAPVDATARSVAGRLPGRDLPPQRRLVGQPPIEALLGQHGKLDLGHVQPAAVLGGVVQLKPVGQSLGLGRLKRLIQRRRGVGVEVVLH